MEHLIQNILNECDSPYIDCNYIASIFEKEQLLQLEKRWGDKSIKKTMLEFIKLMVVLIQHNKEDLLFLIMGLIDLYKEVQAISNSNSEVALSDVTNFICQSYDQVGELQTKIQEFRIPEPKKIVVNKSRIRTIDIDPPKIIGFKEDNIFRIKSNKVITDSVKHTNQCVQDAVFARDINRIITLDSLSIHLNLYHTDAQFERHITHKKEEKDIIILAFAWSSRQQRLGATLKSHNLCFFDYCDRFKNPHVFTTVIASQDYHTGIWFLENYNLWLTTDATNKLYDWDLVEEKTNGVFTSKLIQGQIIECLEILHTKMIATASLDKQILLWNTMNMKDQGGVHTLLYSYWYQVIISCGYSTNISVHQVDPTYFDVSLIGELVGHQSMLTSLLMLGKTPVLASSDDVGTIKLWDIRTFSCIQSVNFGKKTNISKLIDMSSVGFLCFIGSRVNLIEFDTYKKAKFQENYPIKFEMHHSKNELIIASKQEILFVNILNGKTRTILVGLVDREDEITQFRSTNHFNRFFLADSRGNISLHSLNTGEQLKVFKSHQTEILAMKNDLINNNILTVAWDHLIIQNALTGELLREVFHIQNGKEICYVELSVYNNLILVAPSGNTLSIFDYELLKLLGEVQSSSDITSLIFIQNYNAFIIGTTTSIWILSFIIRDQQEIYCDVIGHIQQQSLITQQDDYAVKFLIHELNLYVGSSCGMIYVYELKDLPLKHSKPAYERLNYNAQRNIKEDYLPQKIKVQCQSLAKNSETIEISMKLSFQVLKKSIQCMNFLQLDEKYLITSSIDGLIKILSFDGMIKAVFNINHPLPLMWDLTFLKLDEKRRKIIYALKIIDVLQKQDEQNFNISNSVQKFMISKSKKSQRKEIKILQDEYSPRDLNFDKVKQLYLTEMTGPTLKQMEAHRRFMEAQNEWKKQQIQQQDLEKAFIERETEKKKAINREQNLSFLDGYFHDKLMFEYREKLNPSPFREMMEMKLEQKVGVKKPTSVSPTIAQVVQLPPVQKKINFFDYVSQKNLNSNTIIGNIQSASTTRLQESSISLSNRSSFKPSFYSRNPSRVDELSRMVVKEQEWLVNQKNERKIVNNVLQNLNVKIKKAKNLKHTGSEIQNLVQKVSPSNVMIPSHSINEYQAKMDLELDEIVKNIKYKAQVKLKLELHLRSWRQQKEKEKYLL